MTNNPQKNNKAKILIMTCFSLGLLLLPQISQAKKHTHHKQAKLADFQIFQNDLDAMANDQALIKEIENSLKYHDKTIAQQKNVRSEPKVVKNKKRVEKNTMPSAIADTANNSSINLDDKKICMSKALTVQKPAKQITSNDKKAAAPAKKENKQVATKTRQGKKNHTMSYWETVYALESSSGKRLYRRSNKSRSCKWTNTPCGHYQLSIVALKDIGCTSLKCRSARADYKKSLAMSKKLEEINTKRLKKFGFNNLPDYQKYLVHQQGSAGIKIILKALKGKKTLSKNMLKMMANNSPYSYKYLRRQGSRGAARKFLHFWKEKWKVKSSRRVASR